ncbi:MAG: hypothetical protein JRE43_01625 [Deltaproteobacteria bacterium]|nr:hypothetical protein [Deltaproteobacteria bacterium]
MHSQFVSIAAIAAITLLPILWKTNANAADPPVDQEVLVDCPTWDWQPSPIPNVEYEFCFDDIDHCAAAEMGDKVCFPSLGVHDVWVTAISRETGDPVYYDSDIALIERVESADLSGDGVVGMVDLGLFSQHFGKRGKSAADLDGDRKVGFSDFALITRAFGKCVSASGAVYEQC